MSPPKELTEPGLPSVYVGPYRVVRRIAAGGMGTVYEAEQPGPRGFLRTVAIKLTHRHLADDPSFSAELIEEAKLAAKVRHPNVVQVIDVGEARGAAYVVFEYVDGESLAGLLRWAVTTGTAFPDGIALAIVLDALAGLHAAHELCDDVSGPLELVHRDFSPQNILVGRDGRARLTDFGVAKAKSRDSHTSTGVVKGKTRYLAPEQLRGKKLDRRADVWAAGVVAWEAFARRRLFQAETEADLMLKLVSETPARLRSVRPEIPAELDDALAAALEPNLALRIADADQFAKKLLAACSGFCAPASADEVGAFVRAALAARPEPRDKGDLAELRPEPPTKIERSPAQSATAASRRPRAAIALGAVAVIGAAAVASFARAPKGSAAHATTEPPSAEPEATERPTAASATIAAGEDTSASPSSASPEPSAKRATALKTSPARSNAQRPAPTAQASTKPTPSASSRASLPPSPYEK